MFRAECPHCKVSYPIDKKEAAERIVIQCSVCKTWMHVTKRFGSHRFAKVERRGSA